MRNVVGLFLLPILLFFPIPEKQQDFIDAKPGEWWRIDDDWTVMYFHWSLPWVDKLNLIPKYKYVLILEEVGWHGRWKLVKWCRTFEDGRIIERYDGKLLILKGWVKSHEVEKAKRIRATKRNS